MYKLVNKSTGLTPTAAPVLTDKQLMNTISLFCLLDGKKLAPGKRLAYYKRYSMYRVVAL